MWTYVVIVRISSCTGYNSTRGGVEIVIQYEVQLWPVPLLTPSGRAPPVSTGGEGVRV